MISPYHEEINLLKLSYEHWIRDIWLPLYYGAVIVKSNAPGFFGTLHWAERERVVVPCYSDSCPLCGKYHNFDAAHRDRCETCPLSLYGRGCLYLERSAWRNFTERPTVESAKAVVDTIGEVLMYYKKKEVSQDEKEDDSNRRIGRACMVTCI